MNTVNYNDAEQLFGAVGTSLKKHAAEIADIVNVYGAKNLLPLTVDGIKLANSNTSWSGNSCTINGVTFTILTDNDGNVTGIKANGTATSNATLYIIDDIESYEYPFGGMILSGGASSSEYVRIELKDSPWTSFAISGTSESIVDSSVTQQGTSLVSTYIRVLSGYTSNNSVFKPMIRLASIEDGTYVPYVPTNAELLSADTNAVLGAHNLLKYPYRNTTKTEGGITYTDNGDGTITINGTNTSGTTVWFNFTNRGKLKDIVGINAPGTYIFSRGASALDGKQYYRIYDFDVSADLCGGNTGDLIFTVTKAMLEHECSISSWVYNSKSFDNVVMKPMIRLASDTSTAYAPYAKTNKELTDDIASLAARIKAIEDTNHLTYG